jgi:hypothetical protein
MTKSALKMPAFRYWLRDNYDAGIFPAVISQHLIIFFPDMQGTCIRSF